MNTSRRAFIKTAAAVPAALAIGAPPLPDAAVAAPVTAAKVVSPYTDYPWQWWCSHDDDTYYEAFPTMEEAIEYAKKNEFSIVAECCQQDFYLSVEGCDIIELLDGHNEEIIGEGEGIQCTTEQEKDLGAMVTAAIEAWVLKHNIDITGWTFGGVRNKIKIPQVPDTKGRL
jgi:TAT (twin-arginine translocation) pathway signal sequence